MTRAAFVAAWAGASPDQRFVNFVQWILSSITAYDDLLPPFSVVRDPATTSVAQLGGAAFSVNPAFFTAAQPDDALSAGDAIVGSLTALAMEAYKDWLEAKKQYEKDARKERAKRWDKLLKDSKPKAKDAMGIYYEIYIKPLVELEKGSG